MHYLLVVPNLIISRVSCSSEPRARLSQIAYQNYFNFVVVYGRFVCDFDFFDVHYVPIVGLLLRGPGAGHGTPRRPVGRLYLGIYAGIVGLDLVVLYGRRWGFALARVKYLPARVRVPLCGFLEKFTGLLPDFSFTPYT